LAALPAGAQPLRASPFRGTLIPGGAVAGDADATSLELNPGQLGLLDGPSTALVLNHWQREVPRAGRGAALMLGFPLVGPLSLGLGLQQLRPTLLDEPAQYWKTQVGVGLQLSRALGFGFSWDRLYGHLYGGRSSFTLGLGLRPHRTVALGAVVRDVGRPRPRGDQLARQWEGEVAVRPLGTDRLELALGGRVEQDGAPGVRPRARLSSRVMKGLTLFGELDSARDEHVATDLQGNRTPGTLEWSALFGATVVLSDRVGLTAAALGGTGELPDDAEGALGGSFVLRTFPGRREPLVSSRHVERVKIAGLENDGRFLEVVVRLRRLAADPAVGALLLEIEDLQLGPGRIEELRGLIAATRQRKPVFAQVVQPSMREYYLAAACDRIVVHPAGAVTVGGLAQTVTFYKSALDKLGVNVELVRIAEYKGAMEPFVLTEQSEPVRQNRNALIDDNYSRIVGAIAAGRGPHGLAVEHLPAIIDRALYSAGEAEKARLVDAVADEKDTERLVSAALGRRWAVRGGAGGRFEQRVWNPSRVGVVLIDGAITEGEAKGLPFSTGELAFSDRIIAAIEELRRDGSVKAVVLRVNSPGGSALASDRIARAVVRLRAAKPVVASMGDMAASGGYYVSAPADEIFASPGTTTGSIGIFSIKVDLQGLLAKVGLVTEVYKRGAHADMYSPFRPWTEEERKMAAHQIRNMYQLFLDTVAAGRKSRGLTAERVDQLGRGKIYTGAQARDVRLVDHLGGFSDALDAAVRRGRVPVGPGGVPELVVLPRPITSPLAALMRLAGSEQQAAPPAGLVEQGVGAMVKMLAPLLHPSTGGLEARLPYDIEWR
jgi:protease-4